MNNSSAFEKRVGLSRIGVGVGGLKCPCCAPSPRSARKLLRTAKHVAKRVAVQQETADLYTWEDAWNSPTWFEQSQEEWENAHLLYVYNLRETCVHEYRADGYCYDCGSYSWLHDLTDQQFCNHIMVESVNEDCDFCCKCGLTIPNWEVKDDGRKTVLLRRENRDR